MVSNLEYKSGTKLIIVHAFNLKGRWDNFDSEWSLGQLFLEIFNFCSTLARTQISTVIKDSQTKERF